MPINAPETEMDQIQRPPDVKLLEGTDESAITHALAPAMFGTVPPPRLGFSRDPDDSPSKMGFREIQNSSKESHRQFCNMNAASSGQARWIETTLTPHLFQKMLIPSLTIPTLSRALTFALKWRLLSQTLMFLLVPFLLSQTLTSPISSAI